MPTIIGVSGKRGSGKSLFCDVYLRARGFHIYSFADPLKDDVRRIYGLNKEHTDGSLKELPCDKLGGRTPREAMIAEGEIRRKFSENGLYWVKKLFTEKINQLQSSTFVAIPDVRFKNEANFIKNHGGLLVRLERKSSLNIYKTSLNDISETELDDYLFDERLEEDNNITPQDLEQFADKLLIKIGSLVQKIVS